ncbi:tripartite tricarboxylate transporter substrate binding protein [Pseudorhodoferax sp.]|uniref:tripartite tricarboxylate transporter substrate binding protein n=1 Tax=Pseudorhodoferax sp. TaxID=1993553 RepID=UPI002DD69AF8|nr:tripartite tricarboxylate transporter substrate binding protein [Pseudorhodoferax sp.]
MFKAFSFWRRTGLGLVAGLAVTTAAAQFPDKPIRIIVPFPPGGSSDTIARLLANGMKDKLGQPVLVENKPGAGTIIGTDMVAKGAADGYTLLWMTTPFAINATLFKQLPYDPIKDFTPVSLVTTGPLALIVHPTSPYKTVGELVAAAKKQPGKLTYGSSGNGGSPHLTSEMFKSVAGFDAVHVPYKGSAPSVQDLIAGQTSFVFDTVFLTAPFVQAGRARALAVTGRARAATLPDVPTMVEAGVPGFVATSWLGLAAPSQTPKDVVARLSAAADEVLRNPDIRASLTKQGMDPAGGSPEDAARHVAAEIAWWGKAVRDSGAKPD